jgi:tetratricopeptide (TPR) repeat protein
VRWRALLAQDTATQIDGDRARHAACVAALEALAPDLGVEEMAEAAWRRCYLARVTAKPDEARAAAALAIDLADGAAVVRVAVQARVELCLMEANEGRWTEAAAHAATAEGLARDDGDPWLLARARTTLGYVLAEVGRAAEALALFDGAAEAYARAGDRRREAIALVNGAAVLLRLGRAAEALDRFARAIELSLRIGNVSTVAVALQNRAALHRALGQWDRSRADLDEALPHAAKLQRVRLDAALAVERAYLAVATGAPAGELAARALELARRSRSPALLASGLAVALRAGDVSVVAEARAHAAAVRDAPESEAELRVALRATAGDDEADAAEERFVRSVGEVDDPGSCREMFRRRYLVR